MIDDLRKTERVRHETRRRQLTVAEKTFVTPQMLAIRFTSDDLFDFVSLAADDHVKLILASEPEASGKPPMRDYTPRSFDRAKGELTIEFALHDNPGPATAWAISTAVGDNVTVGGPRGSVVISDRYDWYWLIGDETALPAIARRIAECDSQNIAALIAVTDKAEEQFFASREGLSVAWVHRPASATADADPLLTTLASWTLPDGDGFVWIAAEANVARSVRAHLIERGHPAEQMKAAGYWKHGFSDTTEKFE